MKAPRRIDVHSAVGRQVLACRVVGALLVFPGSLIGAAFAGLDGFIVCGVVGALAFASTGGIDLYDSHEGRQTWS